MAWPCTHDVDPCYCINSAERQFIIRTQHLLDNPYLSDYAVELSNGPVTLNTANTIALQIEHAIINTNTPAILEAWQRAEAAGIAEWKDGEWEWVAHWTR